MKNRKEQYKRSLRILFTLILILAETGVFSNVWLNEYNNYIVLPFVQKGNWFFYAVYIILFSIFLNTFDGVKYGAYRRTNIIIAQTLATISTVFIIYLQITLLAARFVTVLPLLLMVVADIVIISLLSTFGEWILQKLFPAKKLMVVFDNYQPDSFLTKVVLRKDKFVIDKVFNVSVGFDVLEEQIKRAECVLIYDVHSEARNKILKLCFENDVRTYTTTKVSDVLVRGAESLHIFDTPLLLYRNVGLTFEQRFLKRTLDIVVSLILIIVLSPLFLISAVLVKCYDGGPVLFRQARCTIGGKIFYIHKFRSMIVNAEKDGAPRPAEEDDKRITPVGKFLRVTRFDELPQLLDILVGNMSLVGPRPERIEHIKQYTEEIPEFQYRLKVRGGLTGYAQLYGKYNTAPYDKLQLDLMYIQNYSFFLDIKLLLMTIKVIFIKESTEGFSKANSKKIRNKAKQNKD